MKNKLTKGVAPMSPIKVVAIVFMMILILASSGCTENKELDGSLEYQADISEPTFNEGGQAFVYFDITLKNPEAIRAQDVRITVLNADGETVLDDVYWTGHPSVDWSNRDNQNRVRTRSRLELLIHNSWNNVEGDHIRNYEIIIRVEGYDGTFKTNVS